MAEAPASEEGERALVTGTLEYLARSLVEHPDRVSVEVSERERTLVLQLRVSPDDMGRVIGKAGHTARAIRQLVRAAGARSGVHTLVEIVE